MLNTVQKTDGWHISKSACLHAACKVKVVSDSLWLVDFAIGLVNSVLTCLTGKWCSLRNSNNRRTVKSILLMKKVLGLDEMMSGPVNDSFSLPKCQAVKMIFFAPWHVQIFTYINCSAILKVMPLLNTAFYNETFLLTTVFALHLRPLFFTVQRFKNCKTHAKNSQQIKYNCQKKTRVLNNEQNWYCTSFTDSTKGQTLLCYYQVAILG